MERSRKEKEAMKMNQTGGRGSQNKSHTKGFGASGKSFNKS